MCSLTVAIFSLHPHPFLLISNDFNILMQFNLSTHGEMLVLKAYCLYDMNQVSYLKYQHGYAKKTNKNELAYQLKCKVVGLLTVFPDTALF